MARELIAFEFDEVAHDIDKGCGVDDVVVLERVVEQQCAPARPGIGGASGAQNAEAIGRHLSFTEHKLRRQPSLILGIVDRIRIAQLHRECGAFNSDFGVELHRLT